MKRWIYRRPDKGPGYWHLMEAAQPPRRRGLSAADQALLWHMADAALTFAGLIGHFWLRRQYERERIGR